jgi:hypothetical protein
LQEKGLINIFNKITPKNFQNLEKLCPYRCKRPPEHQTDLTKEELPHSILSLKQVET